MRIANLTRPITLFANQMSHLPQTTQASSTSKSFAVYKARIRPNGKANVCKTEKTPHGYKKPHRQLRPQGPDQSGSDGWQLVFLSALLTLLATANNKF